MRATASQITSLTIVYSTFYSGADKKKTSKLRVTGLCEGNSPVTDEFPAQKASNAENVSIWWRHHVWGKRLRLVVAPQKGPVMRKIKRFDILTPPWDITVYPKKYAHGFVVLCFVVVMQSFIINPREIFIHIHQGCFAGTGAIVRLPQCQWSKPDGYGKISQCITTTKHSKAKTVCIFLEIYCRAGPTLQMNYLRQMTVYRSLSISLTHHRVSFEVYGLPSNL